MDKETTPNDRAASLRQRVEALQSQLGEGSEPSQGWQGLAHELRVQQIELEMQNEELRRAQEALEASRGRYFDLYDLAPVGYFRLSEKGLILEANLTAATLLGAARGELAKQPLTCFVLPEDQDIYHRYRKQLLETGAPQACELRMVRQDAPGSHFWARLETTVAQEGEGRVAMSDITERVRAESQREAALEALRASEDKFSKAFRSSPQGVLITRLTDGQFVEVNEAVEKLSGHQREELIGRTSLDLGLVNPEDRESTKRILQEHGWFRNFEARFYTKCGEERVGLFSGEIVEIGEEECIIQVVSDITDRVRAEEERRQLLAELEAKNRELESFVYSVSHDLKAPLVSLDGFSHLLTKDCYDQLGDQGQHYLDRIQANVSHMSALIGDLLELARIGQVAGPTEEIEVAVLLREIQEELAIKLEEAGAELVVQEPLPTVHANRTRIRQVFTNLLENAIKFRSQERPLRIEVGCQQEGGFYRFQVADNGIGIAPEYQELIFGLFRQLDPQREGVGMGLALVQKIVEHHGGRVWMESEEGRGATLYFTLPK